MPLIADEYAMTLSTLRSMIEQYAITYGDFTLSSGAKSRYYIDMRKLTLRFDTLQSMVKLIRQRVGLFNGIVGHANSLDTVGGPCIGADPIVGAVLHEAICGRGFLVRKENKAHGLQKRVEGDLRAGDHVLIVEDVVTTGASTIDVIDVVEAAGAKVGLVISVLDREQGAEEAIKLRLGIPSNPRVAYKPLVRLSQLTISPPPVSEAV